MPPPHRRCGFASASCLDDEVHAGLSPRAGRGAARGDEEMIIGLVTDDLDLYLASVTAGFDATNFTHERARRFG